MTRKTVLTAICLLCLMISACGHNATWKLYLNNHCFQVELAISDEEKARGLMFRKDLADNRGMLFIFDREDEYMFWMKNTYIPLDIIWLNKDKEVVYIAARARPQKDGAYAILRPDKNAQYVLEVNAGVCERVKLKVGDKVIF